MLQKICKAQHPWEFEKCRTPCCKSDAYLIARNERGPNFYHWECGDCHRTFAYKDLEFINAQNNTQ
jgi:transposase-like protein